MRSFDKIVHVIDVLATSSERGVTLREVQDASGLNRGGLTNSIIERGRI